MQNNETYIFPFENIYEHLELKQITRYHALLTFQGSKKEYNI